jgi:carboxyl-terminal processing protease
MNSRTRLVVLLVSAPIIAFAVIGGLLGQAMARENTYQHLRVFQDVVSLVLRNYVETVNSDRVMAGAMRGLAESLDADSAYLTKDDLKAYEKGARPAGGVGIELTRQYYLRVIAVRDLSPAIKAGLRSGDYIRVIDDKPTRDMSVFEGMRRLRGAPGTRVKLTIIRSNIAEPHVVELTREALPAPKITARVLANNVGYLRIPAIGATTPDEVRARVAEVRKQGATRLIVDVRDCAGGDLLHGVALARVFVASGTLAVREVRNQPREPITAAAGDGAISLPTTLLIDAGTSGPAELFAAALKGNGRADAVGERTLGRATLQTLVPLPDGTALLLSNAWILAPNGDPIQAHGITPDVEVEEPDVEFGTAPPSGDPILEKAMERIGGKSGA